MNWVSLQNASTEEETITARLLQFRVSLHQCREHSCTLESSLLRCMLFNRRQQRAAVLNTRVVRILQPCISLFGHGGLWQGLWEPGHGRLHTSSVPCLSAQELSPRSPFQMDLGPASLSSLLSNELECGVNRVRIWAPPVKTSSFTQHSQLIERVVFCCLGQTFKCSQKKYCFSIRLDN